MKRLRLLIVPVVALSLLAFGVAPSFAAGAGAVNFTQTFHNATDTFTSPLTCADSELYNIAITYNGVFHVTELTSGVGADTDWLTGTETGTFTATPANPSSTSPSYTGHFATWFGGNDNLQNGNGTVTINIHGTGSDGSTLSFQAVQHFSVSATGITVEFAKPCPTAG